MLSFLCTQQRLSWSRSSQISLGTCLHTSGFIRTVVPILVPVTYSGSRNAKAELYSCNKARILTIQPLIDRRSAVLYSIAKLLPKQLHKSPSQKLCASPTS
jgi:hypothetical protein